MIRYKEIKVLPYSSIVKEHVALEALKWCEEYNGFGSFSFSWVFVMKKDNNDINDVVGEFGFSDHKDHTLFNMFWV